MLFAAFAVWALPGAVMGKESHRRNYDTVRRDLIKSGYQVLKVRRLDNDDYYCSEGFCGIYPETLYCSLAGLHYCNMGFYRPADRKYLVVTTLGEVEFKMTVVKIGEPNDEDMRHILGRPGEP